MNRTIPMTAGILALASGAYQAWCVPQLLHAASTYSEILRGLEQYTTSFHAFAVWLTTEAAASIVAALALILGGAMVLAGKSLGRAFVVVGCVIAFVHTGVGWVMANDMLHWFAEIGGDDSAFPWFNMPSMLAIGLLSVIVPVIAAILVLQPATRQWCQGVAAKNCAAKTDSTGPSEID